MQRGDEGVKCGGARGTTDTAHTVRPASGERQEARARGKNKRQEARGERCVASGKRLAGNAGRGVAGGGGQGTHHAERYRTNIFAAFEMDSFASLPMDTFSGSCVRCGEAEW